MNTIRAFGPYLEILQRMLYVTATFLIIVLVVLVPSGIAQQALLYPHRMDNAATSTSVFFFDYYRLYGELNLDNSLGRRVPLLLRTISDSCFLDLHTVACF